jgi:hypothetical protein
MQKLIYIFLALGLLLAACDPYQVDDVALPAPPTASFSWSYVPGDSNSVVVEASSPGNNLLWEFPSGASKPKSTLAQDTVEFSQRGDYEITLYLTGQGGTSVDRQMVNIPTDKAIDCDSTVLLLAGGCGVSASKTWVWSQEANAVSVGPVPLSAEWFGSPAGGLVPEQYDDSWTFEFDGANFVYDNNGQSVNPYDGYVAQDITPPAGTWLIREGSGFEGADQLVISDQDLFLGVMDSGPVYDIIEVSETELVLVSPIMNSDGSEGTGYFTLYFVAQ